MTRKIRTLLLALAVVAVLAVIGGVVFTASQPAPLPPFPNPNGYDDLVRAGQMIPIIPDDYRTATEEELRAFVTTNTPALQLARVGLGRGCRVPMDLGKTNFAPMSDGLVYLKYLTILLAAEGRLAEVENRPANAARSYVDAIRLGNEISRGGFMINRLVGIACEAIGSFPLVKLVSKLNCEQARPFIAELEGVDIGGVTWDEVRRAENAYVRHELRKTFNPIRWVAEWWLIRPARQRAEAKHKNIVTRLRLLTTELALRCYQSDQGRVPLRLEELVPKYLKRVPSDPFSGQPLVYRGQGTSWLLYSLGPDKVDDGGKPVGGNVWGQPNPGDLFFDAP